LTFKPAIPETGIELEEGVVDCIVIKLKGEN
jgi:hypothetical protein